MSPSGLLADAASKMIACGWMQNKITENRFEKTFCVKEYDEFQQVLLYCHKRAPTVKQRLGGKDEGRECV